VARRKIIAQHDPGQAPVTLRVHLTPHVDLELTAKTARSYAAADELGRREMANRLLADHIELAGLVEAPVAAGSQIVTDNDRRAETEVAEDAAVRAARTILLAGNRGAEADRLRAELEELTGKRVRLDIWEAPDPNAG
jgi:hypothetical protein